MLLLNILLISSCQTQDKYIEVSKISCVEDISTSSFMIYLNVYTSTNIKEIEIKKNKYINNITKNYQTVTEYIFEQTEEPANLYQYLITFKKTTFSILTLDVIIDNVEKTVDIGLYKIVELEEETLDILVTSQVINDELYIYIHNQMDRTIYLTKITQVDNSLVKITPSKIIPSESYIYSDDTKRMLAAKLTIPSNIYMTKGIIKLEFTTNLKQYSIYTTYYHSKVQDVIKLV